MKVKLLLMLLLASLSIGVLASEGNEKKRCAHLYIRIAEVDAMKRSPSGPFAEVEDINYCLYITFQRSLGNVDIAIQDKNGNEVVNEQQTFLYEGRVITIPQADGYPYSIEITSPTVIIQGEIIIEE